MNNGEIIKTCLAEGPKYTGSLLNKYKVEKAPRRLIKSLESVLGVQQWLRESEKHMTTGHFSDYHKHVCQNLGVDNIKY